MQIAVTSTCKSDDKRNYQQLLGELINDANIGHLRKSCNLDQSCNWSRKWVICHRCGFCWMAGGHRRGVCFTIGTAFRWSLW
jgi:hypothetical protein